MVIIFPKIEETLAKGYFRRQVAVFSHLAVKSIKRSHKFFRSCQSFVQFALLEDIYNLKRMAPCSFTMKIYSNLSWICWRLRQKISAKCACYPSLINCSTSWKNLLIRCYSWVECGRRLRESNLHRKITSIRSPSRISFDPRSSNASAISPSSSSPFLSFFTRALAYSSFNLSINSPKHSIISATNACVNFLSMISSSSASKICNLSMGRYNLSVSSASTATE